MQKLDVIIPAISKDHIRPALLAQLESAAWVNNIIIETSSPLSTARVNAARKCTTEWLMYCDDDVEIPRNILDVYEPFTDDPRVLAVSSQAYDHDSRWLAYRRALYAIWKDHHAKRGNFDNRCYIIRRKVMLDYRPIPCFYCEDTALAQHVQRLGIWKHLPFCGVWHFPAYKNRAYFGYAVRQMRLAQTMEPFFGFVGQMAISYIVFLMTLSVGALLFAIKGSVEFLAGYMMAIANGE